MLTYLATTHINTTSCKEPTVHLTETLSVYIIVTKSHGRTDDYAFNKANCQEASELLPKTTINQTSEFNDRALIPQQGT